MNVFVMLSDAVQMGGFDSTSLGFTTSRLS